MITTVLQENLVKALTQTSRILSAKPNLPILQNVLLSTEEGRLRVITSNLETTEATTVGAKVEKDGGLCVPARLMTDLILSLPPGAVRLEAKEGSLFVSSGGTKATIPGVSASEFPPVQSTKQKGAMVFDKNLLIDAIRRVQFCAATDEGRPLLTGVKMVGKENRLTLAATDGYRLSVKHLDIQLKEEIDMVVPARALLEVVKISQEEKEAKEIQFAKTEDGQLALSINDTDVVTRLIDGDYPNYQKIIPSKFATRAHISAKGLARAVKSASIFARDNANIIKLHVDKNSLLISANTPSVGENVIDVEAQVEGDGGDIAFNSRFLTEFLSNTQEEELVFEMTGALNPGVFHLPKDDTYLHIIMPVRVASG